MWGNGSEDLVEKWGRGQRKTERGKERLSGNIQEQREKECMKKWGWGIEQSFQKMPHVAEDADANCWGEPSGIVSKPMHPTMA